MGLLAGPAPDQDSRQKPRNDTRRAAEDADQVGQFVLSPRFITRGFQIGRCRFVIEQPRSLITRVCCWFRRPFRAHLVRDWCCHSFSAACRAPCLASGAGAVLLSSSSRQQLSRFTKHVNLGWDARPHPAPMFSAAWSLSDRGNPTPCRELNTLSAC